MGAPTGLTNMAGPKTKVFIGGREVTHIYAHVALLYDHAGMSILFKIAYSIAKQKKKYSDYFKLIQA